MRKINFGALWSAILQARPAFVLFFATVLTFLGTGYLPISDNNVYHLPVLLKAFDLPQFAEDPFIQSLRYFSSGFWLLFSGAGHFIEPKLFLAIWLVITHAAFLAAALHFASSLGCTHPATRNLFVLLLAVAGPVIGTTIGGGGILLHYFTHSELANATLVLGFSYGLRGRYGPAALATAVTFFLNAFMAVWMILPLLFLAAYQLSTKSVRIRALICQGMAGSIAGAVFIALPVVNVLSSPANATDFSYGLYLREYFAKHFFIDANSPLELASLGAMVVTIILLCRLLGQQARPFLMLCIGACVLLLIGMAAPLISESRFLLNLHLVRAAVVIVMLATIALALVTARWLVERQNRTERVFGLMLVAALLSRNATFILAPPLLFAAVQYGTWSVAENTERLVFWHRAAWGFLAVMLLLVFVQIGQTFRAAAESHAAIARWERIGLWAHANLPEDATFLIVPDADRADAVLGFAYTSLRSQRAAEKFGAAVMWSPAYYASWERFGLPMRSLVEPAGKLSHARDMRAGYIGLECSTELGPPLHRDGDMCIYAVGGSTAS